MDVPSDGSSNNGSSSSENRASSCKSEIIILASIPSHTKEDEKQGSGMNPLGHSGNVRFEQSPVPDERIGQRHRLTPTGSILGTPQNEEGPNIDSNVFTPPSEPGQNSRPTYGVPIESPGSEFNCPQSAGEALYSVPRVEDQFASSSSSKRIMFTPW